MQHDTGVAASAKESPSTRLLAGIQARVTSGKITWTGPLTLLVARTLLLVVGQSLVAGIYLLRGHPSPWTAAVPWWSVFWTAADLGCLLLLAWFTRREGLGITDLFGHVRLRWGHDILLGLGLWLLIFPAFVLAVPLGSLLAYGSPQPEIYPGQLFGRVLPLWAVVYSLVSIFLWSATEETSYQGYVLPRLEVLTGRPWVAVLLVGFWWALQHSFVPLILDWRYAIWRFFAFLPVILLMVAYRKIRRLSPLIVAHWPMDVVAVLMTLRW